MKTLVMVLSLVFVVGAVSSVQARANDGKTKAQICADAESQLDDLAMFIFQYEAGCTRNGLTDAQCMERVHYLRMIWLYLNSKFEATCR